MLKYLVIILSITSIAYGQSFNCGSDSLSQTEQLICGNGTIKKYDSELTSLYKQALKDSGKYDYLVKDSQKSWLMRRNKCTDVGCVSEEYNTRIRWYKEKLYKDMYELRFGEWTEGEQQIIKDLKDNYTLYDSNTDADRISRCTAIYEDLINGKVKPIEPIVYRGSLEDLDFNLDACVKLDTSEIYTTTFDLWNMYFRPDSPDYNGLAVFLPRTDKNRQEVKRNQEGLYKMLLTRGINMYRLEYDNNTENGLEIVFETQGRLWGHMTYFDDRVDDVDRTFGYNTDSWISDYRIHFVVNPYQNCSEKYNKVDKFIFKGGGVMEAIDPSASVVPYDSNGNSPSLYFYYQQKPYKLTVGRNWYDIGKFQQNPNQKESENDKYFAPVTRFERPECSFLKNK